MRFAKYHGLGNDFVVVDVREIPKGDRDGAVGWLEQSAVDICSRRFGVGADGVLVILASATADARMRVLNSDGSEAQMCGNGLRCVVKHLIDRDTEFADRGELAIETMAGVLRCQARRDGSQVETVTVDMGAPRLTRGEIPMLGDATARSIREPAEGVAQRFTAVSMGNPHAVHFADVGGVALRALAEDIGPRLEVHPDFPERTNVEFARITAPDAIELVVWERGCGITLACGTGACATVVAACLEGHLQPGAAVTVTLLGGPLEITVASDYSQVTMAGKAVHVFDGTLSSAEFARVVEH